MRSLSIGVILSAAAVLVAGCLPGQQRTTPRELFPADSLSRQLAEATAEQTLELVWQKDLPPEVRYPVTLAWYGDRIFVADLQHGGIHSLTDAGEYVGGFIDDVLEYPLIAGASADTVAVLSRGRNEVHLAVVGRDGDGTVVRTTRIPEGRNLVAAWSDGVVFSKVAEEARGARISALDPTSRVSAEYELGDPFWRHIGFLRAWGDTLVSLGGYRPVIQVVRKDAPSGTEPDSLFLMGFDSPQLERSRLFVLGEIREPPLLVPSAAAAGERLFVLNARPGWAHVDVFRRGDAELVLEASLLSPEPEIGRNYFAADLAVQSSDGGFDLIVLETRPRPAVVRYRWR